MPGQNFDRAAGIYDATRGYVVSGSNVVGNFVTPRSRVRSNTCMPCCPAPSATTYA